MLEMTTGRDRETGVMPEGWLLDLGRRPYREAWALHHALVDRRAEDRIRDGLILVEHEPVITLGRRGTPADILEPGLEVVEVERGGEAPYHGPGQLVGYPVLRLPDPPQGKRLVPELGGGLHPPAAD